MSSQARFQKSQREKAKREKAQAKQERKGQRRDEAELSGAPDGPTPAAEEARILAELRELHQLHADEAISFDEFEQRRDELTAQLRT